MTSAVILTSKLRACEDPQLARRIRGVFRDNQWHVEYTGSSSSTSVWGVIRSSSNTIEYVDIRDRRASRLLVIDRQNRVLLLQYEDEHGKWWATPGGGIRDFESFENAALREAREELGLSGFPIQPLWQGINDFKSRGVRLRQTEQFFLIRADGSDVLVDAEVAKEHAIEGIIAIRWWSSDELRTTNERVFPVDLPSRIEDILLQPS